MDRQKGAREQDRSNYADRNNKTSRNKIPDHQGGMAWVAEHHLAAAVSEAGGLGLIGAASAPAEWVREQIRAARKLTDKPFE